MEFRILGPLEALDGERRLPLGGSKRRAVLGLLLLDANDVVSTERLIDGVWGEAPPAGALASLQNHVLRLRRELGERIVTRAPGYLLRVEPGELDLDRFRRLVDAARTSEPDEAGELLARALAIWRGRALADLVHEPVAAAAAGLDELRLEALELRVDADLELGRHSELVSELEALVLEQPFRERLRAQLVLALYRSGRQADALAAYANARAAFSHELGVEPGPDLQALQRAVLRHDPTLQPPARSAPRGSPVEEARKTVTVLLADLRPGAESDPEARRRELERATTAAAVALEAHGGTVGHSLGDRRVLGIFGAPVAREDDALRAIQAACELRAAGLLARAAVATGDVVTGDRSRGRPLVSGAPLQEADRLLAAAGDGEISAGERTWRLVRHGVVGSAGAVERVLEGAEAVVRRFETPLVGRADELAELLAGYRGATADGRARLVTVLAAPGVGKTRLARELVAVVAESATCLVGRTPSYGAAPTYEPLRDAFWTLAEGRLGEWAARLLAGESDGEPIALRIAAAAGETPSRWPVAETAWAVRRVLETLAVERPVVLVLEDLHDAAPALLDLVEHVATLARGPILLLVLARPELLDRRPDWGAGGVGRASILLDALPRADATDLLDRLIGATPVAPARREAILAAAEGNPLFLEQLLAATSEAGGDTSVPDSIHALLAARLDRLDEADRAVIETAAVCGHTFPVELVQAVVGEDVRGTLLALARRDFVEPGQSDPLGRETWLFRHALVRDEAYATLTKRRRARLHEQIADLIAADAEERGVDASELIGHHLESAHRAAADVDPQARELKRLAAAAAHHLATAGRRAYDERNASTAAALLRRAYALVPPTAPDRVDIAVRLAGASSWTDEVDVALRVLDEAESQVSSTDERALASLLVARHHILLWRREPKDPALVLADAQRAIRILEDAGDHEGVASAHILAYHLSYRLASGLDPGRELALAVEHARAAGARGLEGIATSWLCVHLRHGPLPVDEAKKLVIRILDDPPSEFARASALGTLGDLRAMEGAFDEARALVGENHAILEELGLPQTSAADLVAVGEVELMAGDADAAERILREALERLGALGDRFTWVNAAWRLALLLVRQRRDEEAKALLAAAEDDFGGDFARLWQIVLGATLAARHGQPEDARTLLEEADRDLGRLTALGMRVDLLLHTAEVDELLGQPGEAAKRLRRAAALAEELGYVVAEHAAADALARA